MTEETEKCDANTILFTEITSTVKEEFEDEDYVDDKVSAFETVLNITKTEEEDYVKNVKIEEGAVYTSDNVKTELSSSLINNMINTNIKDEIDFVDVLKIESNSEVLFCNNCSEDYQDYCIKCGMLVHILNRNTDERDEIPKDILEIRESFGQMGIFALKVIPENVKFGPFIGLGSSQCPWNIKRGKFIVADNKSEFLNWMWYVNPARNISEQNLVPFQTEGNIYYRSIHEIQEGAELLVYLGEEYEDSINNDVVMDFIPTVETQGENVYACTFCCLGFCSATYLAKHKTICCNKSAGNFSIEELTQCPFCKIYLDEKEYFNYHMNYCCKRSDSKNTLLTLNNETMEVKRGKTQRLQMYKCTQCKYKTAYKSDLKSHTNKHYEVKTYRCEICSRRFKTKEFLRLHMEDVHIGVEGKGAQTHRDTDYTEAERPKLSQSSHELNEKQQFKCPECHFRTNYKYYLRIHVGAEHPGEFKFKCDLCEYKTNFVVRLKNHVKMNHLKEFRYECKLCEFKANRKWDIERHTKTKHLKEFSYECEVCGYKTNDKSKLNGHTKTKHLEEFSYKCETCDHKTNRKADLEMHVKTKHLKEFNHECTSCSFKTNYKSGLENHVRTKHLKEFNYKCVDCGYKTNRKSDLERHTKTKHLKEFDYACERCDYKTNDKSNLKTHMKTRHLEEFSYKCETCQYETNNRSNFEGHVKTKHLEEFSHCCELCGYKTNRKWDLEKHTRTKHLKEFKFKCELCEYETNRKWEFEKHMKTKHLNEYNYNCEICYYKTNYQSNLKRHTRKKHLVRLSE